MIGILCHRPTRFCRSAVDVIIMHCCSLRRFLRMFFRLVLTLAFATLLAACKSLYFQPAGAAPEPPPQYRLDAWPEGEYWSGIVFNGNKIGFSRLALAP